jgi:hypothetical protein
MATLIKKGKKSADGAGNGNGEAAHAPEPVAHAPEPEAHAHTPSTALVDTRKPPQPPGPPVDTTPWLSYAPSPGDTYDGPLPPNFPRSYGSATPYDVGATYEPPRGAGDFQLPNRHIAAEPPPSAEPASGPPGLLQRVLMFTGEQTPEERDRVAAQEFEAAIAPVMEYMRQHLPEASTPDEAAQIWSQNQGEITQDPKGGSYVPGDAFDADARVYYRLLRRDYEKNPRPSLKRKESRALSRAGGAEGFRLLPGTRGW